MPNTPLKSEFFFFWPSYRFLWQNLDFGWLCTAGGTRGSQGVNDLRDIFLFVQILFIWVAFDCKPIFGIQHFSILTRLTRWVPLGFWFLAKFSIFFYNFSKSSNACSIKFYKIIVKSLLYKKCWKLSVDAKYTFKIKKTIFWTKL